MRLAPRDMRVNKLDEAEAALRAAWEEDDASRSDRLLAIQYAIGLALLDIAQSLRDVARNT